METLRLYPFPCPCGKHEPKGPFPPGMLHPKSERCALVSDTFQYEVAAGTCCTYDGQEIVEALKLLGDPDLARQVAETKMAEEAADFSSDLEFVACEHGDFRGWDGKAIKITPKMLATESLL